MQCLVGRAVLETLFFENADELVSKTDEQKFVKICDEYQSFSVTGKFTIDLYVRFLMVGFFPRVDFCYKLELFQRFGEGFAKITQIALFTWRFINCWAKHRKVDHLFMPTAPQNTLAPQRKKNPTEITNLLRKYVRTRNKPLGPYNLRPGVKIRFQSDNQYKFTKS